ncbi:hypothetical protein EB796_015953 [Bugula neritina]|uniref:EF-hand domain-containing protein n=1 Tax=Bugula neritina TaxID=10212 RepID=A0A7J7JH79_BUGNE|nr:hypothetical protein EB796_015953 [Bugula neritina]
MPACVKYYTWLQFIVIMVCAIVLKYNKSQLFCYLSFGILLIICLILMQYDWFLSLSAIYDCFAQFDTSGDGVIDRDELPDALRFAGINPSDEDVDFVIKQFDTNSKCVISELVENWEALSQHSVNGDELMNAFNTLDLDHDGFIKLDEMLASL